MLQTNSSTSIEKDEMVNGVYLKSHTSIQDFTTSDFKRYMNHTVQRLSVNYLKRLVCENRISQMTLFVFGSERIRFITVGHIFGLLGPVA